MKMFLFASLALGTHGIPNAEKKRQRLPALLTNNANTDHAVPPTKIALSLL